MHNAYVACNFSSYCETEGLLKVTGSHFCWEGGISRKWCKTKTLLLQATDWKWYMAYGITLFPVILSDRQSHSPIASFSNAIFRAVVLLLRELAAVQYLWDSWASSTCCVCVCGVVASHTSGDPVSTVAVLVVCKSLEPRLIIPCIMPLWKLGSRQVIRLLMTSVELRWKDSESMTIL